MSVLRRKQGLPCRKCGKIDIVRVNGLCRPCQVLVKESQNA